MKNGIPKDENDGKRERFSGRDSTQTKGMMMKRKKKNMSRLGGEGLSLEAFANAKTRSDSYNPSLIKKQREFYKNAKYVNKYKKLQQNKPNDDPSLATRQMKDDSKSSEATKVVYKNKLNKRSYGGSLNALYEKRREEEEKARNEREAIIRAKEEERKRSESQRKALREKMYKRTKHGQPVMKYRIEHMLQAIQRSSSA